MKTKLIFLLLACLPVAGLVAQHFVSLPAELKQSLPTDAPQPYRVTMAKAAGWGLCFLGGFTHGLREAYHAEPGIFERRFGAKPDGYFGSQSWKRKYHDYDGGNAVERSVLYTPVSDFWHVSAWLEKGYLMSGTVVVFIGERRRLKHYLLDFGISFVAASAGSAMSYGALRN